MSDEFPKSEGSGRPSLPPTAPSWWGYIEDDTLIPPAPDDDLIGDNEDGAEDRTTSRLNLYVGLAVAGLLIGFVVVLLVVRG